MVRTGDGVYVLAASMRRLPMLTCVVKSADFAVLAFGHNHALLQDFVRDEIPGVAARSHGNEVPAAKEYPQPLLLEDGRVVKERCGQGQPAPVRIRSIDRHCTTSGGAPRFAQLDSMRTGGAD